MHIFKLKQTDYLVRVVFRSRFFIGFVEVHTYELKKIRLEI